MTTRAVLKTVTFFIVIILIGSFLKFNNIFDELSIKKYFYRKCLTALYKNTSTYDNNLLGILVRDKNGFNILTDGQDEVVGRNIRLHRVWEDYLQNVITIG
jgi:hypothetical protein